MWANRLRWTGQNIEEEEGEKEEEEKEEYVEEGSSEKEEQFPGELLTQLAVTPIRSS